MRFLKILIASSWIFISAGSIHAQMVTLEGKVTDAGQPMEFANIILAGTDHGTTTDSLGAFQMKGVPSGEYELNVSYLGYETYKEKITLGPDQVRYLEIDMTGLGNATRLEDVVISGTMKEVNRMTSPVPVETYNPVFFRKNPSPNVFTALQNVNGVRPQVNCNVCNTGDIHINGLEGPYTMVLIDGMPIVSSLGSVYGLSGIPSSLIERVEIVKGPASSLYGSEAIGGLINIITRKSGKSAALEADVFATSWGEYNVDVGFKLHAGKRADILTGINYFNFQNIIDKNGDNFTDLTLQDRISVFQKWNFERKDNRLFSLVGRYLYEDRWGGDVRWNRSYRGGDEIYAESIFTNRAELIGNYQLPLKEKLFFGFSLISHDQDSRYGDESYIADQKIAFGQLTWDRTKGNHDFLAGLALRYTYYDDNTPVTASADGTENQPEKTWLPGIFIQDEIGLSPSHKLLMGFRYDHNNYHGNIYTPRIAYRWTLHPNSIFRLNAGTGFRVVNLFNEDHAALTGAKEVVILNDLKPEKSYNINANFAQKFYFDGGTFLGLDATVFYTYFSNLIIPDYESDPRKIIYDNITDGYAESKGMSLNTDLTIPHGPSFILGATLMANPVTEEDVTRQQMKTEHFSGTWTVSYHFDKINTLVDYTGNVYSPMRLPLLGELDPRPGKSPWWSIQNIQFTYEGFQKWQVYAGVKNLLNWTPFKSTPFPITRTFDPFDEQVRFDPDGKVISTPDNPNALIFDPDDYVYAPNQGIHGFVGIRYKLD